MSTIADGLNSRFFQDFPWRNPPPQLGPQGLNDYYWAPQSIRPQAQLLQSDLIDTEQFHAALERSRSAVSNEIHQFLEDHRALRTILRQAIDPLKATFGADIVFNLEVSRDEDGSETIYAVAIWQSDALRASEALRAFLENWWLQRMNAATSDLAFVYKLV
jgi:hypothetical protein